MIIQPFDATAIKVVRARHHLQELKSEIQGFFQRGGAYVTFEIAEEYGGVVGGETGSFTYREREPIPNQWSAIIGDILHNLRASLDLLACDLHRMAGGPVKEIAGVHYPFCQGKSYLPDMIRQRRLGHVGAEFLKLIEETAPYKDGNDGLRAIHDLNIIDKHQSIVPTLAVVSIDWPVPITSASQQFVTGVKTNGQRLIIFPRGLCDMPLGSQIKADFSVVFDSSVSVFSGREVARQLQACLESVEIILSSFRSTAKKKTALGVGIP